MAKKEIVFRFLVVIPSAVSKAVFLDSVPLFAGAAALFQTIKKRFPDAHSNPKGLPQVFADRCDITTSRVLTHDRADFVMDGLTEHNLQYRRQVVEDLRRSQ
jgi:hypothetical protein